MEGYRVLFSDEVPSERVERFRAYCFDGEGRRMPPVVCFGAKEAWNYVLFQRDTGMFPDILVEDENGYTVIKVENHEVVFPRPERKKYPLPSENE